MAPPDHPDSQLWTPARAQVSRRSFLANTARLGLGAVVASSAAGSLLAACGGGGDSSGSGDTMDFWQWYAPQEGGSYSVKAQNDWFTKLANDWNAQEGKPRVKLTYIPDRPVHRGHPAAVSVRGRQGP